MTCRAAINRTASLEELCALIGAHYDGIQETSRGAFLVLTETETGSTGYVPLAGLTLARLREKVAEIRRRFGR